MIHSLLFIALLFIGSDCCASEDGKAPHRTQTPSTITWRVPVKGNSQKVDVYYKDCHTLTYHGARYLSDGHFVDYPSQKAYTEFSKLEKPKYEKAWRLAYAERLKELGNYQDYAKKSHILL